MYDKAAPCPNTEEIGSFFVTRRKRSFGPDLGFGPDLRFAVQAFSQPQVY